jgi:hypothetical protein
MSEPSVGELRTHSAGAKSLASFDECRRKISEARKINRLTLHIGVAGPTAER